MRARGQARQGDAAALVVEAGAPLLLDFGDIEIGHYWFANIVEVIVLVMILSDFLLPCRCVVTPSVILSRVADDDRHLDLGDGHLLIHTLVEGPSLAPNSK